MSREKIVMCWSGGKDSAIALYELQQSKNYEVIALLTTVTKGYERISMHGVRRVLLEEQARALGIPLRTVEISVGAENTEYEKKMATQLLQFRNDGVQKVAFGDIFLEDLKRYREDNLAKVNMKGLFPIWKRDTRELVRAFVKMGFQAHVVCVNPKVLDHTFVGRSIDLDFLRDLPNSVDPCGENGEFHSFVWTGPNFKWSVRCAVGEKVERDSFWFADLLPIEQMTEKAYHDNA